MKLSMNWLSERFGAPLAPEAWAERFTLAGLECELLPASSDTRLDGVVVGHITGVAAHPEADKLRVCTVDDGSGSSRQIVCGADNAREGMAAPLALPGSRMPDGRAIEATELRGVASAGMLCSAAELGLAESSKGLLELDLDAPAGQPLAEWLGLDDTVIEFELTPDRGDCLSVLGVAREAAALEGQQLPVGPAPTDIPEDGAIDARTVAIEAPALCPVYWGRRIHGVDATRRSPDWLRERLRRSGLRSVSLVVDITNYVMLELGQPLHAFNDAALCGTVCVRRAEQGETLRLLNDENYTLDHGELVIADDDGAVALAGVMGGQRAEMRADSGVVFLESACFLPEAVAGTGRRHKLHSDAVHRYERGVDPALARRALDRATALILELAGGTAGAAVMAEGDSVKAHPVTLRRQRLDDMLGVTVAGERVRRILESLGMTVREATEGWEVVAPSWRYDIAREVDLVEEVARVIGYDEIGASDYAAQIAPRALPEGRRSDSELRAQLVARGFSEVVSYSFVEGGLDAALRPDAARIPVDNPIAEPYDTMRSTLWSSLLPVVRHNVSRQQRRLRIFEIAHVFEAAPGVHPDVRERECLAGAMLGRARPEHWDERDGAVDFFDLKGELQAIAPQMTVEAARHPALHPGRCAQLLREGEMLGWMGQIHPQLAARVDVPESLLLFELDLAVLRPRTLPWQPQVPEYPSSRRDLSLVVAEDVRCADLLATAHEAAPTFLRDIVVFDVYQGAGLENGCKAMALGLIFQDYSRTLTDERVDEATQGIVEAARRQWGARIRG